MVDGSYVGRTGRGYWIFQLQIKGWGSLLAMDRTGLGRQTNPVRNHSEK